MPGVVGASYLVEYKSGGLWFPLSSGAVGDFKASGEMGLSDNGVAFGDQAVTNATIGEILASDVGGLDFTRLPVRITPSIGVATALSFVGVVARASGDLDTVTWECAGMIADLPARTRNLYSPLFYRRPAATKTTVLSIEDPTDPSYQAGLVNWVLWQAGGRPYEQAATYSTADFYYSCQQAIRAPDWTWIAGENGWDECLRLVRAVGGQLYQGADGVISYRQPLNIIGTSLYTFGDSDYADLSWEQDHSPIAATITCAFTPRRIQPTQQVIEYTTPRVIAAGATLTIDLEPQWPLYSVVLDGGTLKDKNITFVFFDGRLAPYDASTGFTTTTTVYAQRITVVISNNTGWHGQLTKIVIDGQPVAAGVTQTVTVGTGDAPIKPMEDNEFVQTEAHAMALATMALAFYGLVRPTRTLKECVNNLNLTHGATVQLTCSELGLTNAQHLILRKEDSDGAAAVDYTLVDATNLPTIADFWLVKSTSQAGTRTIGW